MLKSHLLLIDICSISFRPRISISELQFTIFFTSIETVNTIALCLALREGQHAVRLRLTLESDMMHRFFDIESFCIN